MRLLVTGGAGYMGSVLVPMLLDAGHHVTVLDRFSFSQATLLDRCIDDRFNVVRGDCRDADTMSRALIGVDAVFALAAIVGAPACADDPIAARTTNLDAIRLLLDLRSNDTWVLFPTTNTGYGLGEEDKICTEDTPLRPVSLYGKTKVEAEAELLSAGNAISLRPGTLFGMSPRMRVDLLVNDFVYRAVTDRTVVVFEGYAQRNYCHVRDVSRAFLHSLDHFEDMRNEAYNVGIDENFTKLELCRLIGEQIPGFVYVEAEIGEDPDKRDYIVSNDKIKATGFRQLYDLETGIREMRKGFVMLRNTRYANNL